MKIHDRLARMLRADAHGVLDALEERSLLLRQHLREAEIALDRTRARASALEERERRLEEESGRLAKEVARLDDDLELALGSGEDTLARYAAARLLPVRRALEETEAERGEVAAESGRLRQTLETREAELAGLTRRVQAALARERRAPRDGVCEGPVSEEEIDLELLRRRGGRDTREDRA